MTNPDNLQAARILARRKFNKMTTSQLPIEALSLDSVSLNLLETPELVVRTICLIATTEYGLVAKGGIIDLPQMEPRISPHTLESRYQAPAEFRGIPPMDNKRPYRRGKVEMNKGQE